ncbi:DNA-3-methyladenine glycosylase [Arthrobacter sp. ISL-30]|uniref:DNA-3-methyladenine glycosylase n=1 Tax=Arthrobacter sp. ISL-30 TaxID=2819109 RepID=UPI001BEB2D51|nr:DNA-3-methyladenine glycosylase [Arthrobacter sp. ISL-30]MBT2514199.1 DNA-3-methyladenine glycosylase [Arthrobacter sp. ISL-30]
MTSGRGIRELLAVDPRDAAKLLLGAVLSHHSPEGTVAVRLTEVEAYFGQVDPGSHAYRGRTARNAPMFGPAGHLYVYFTYGMHHCANLVTGPDGTASAVLLRAGEVVEGRDLARSRRASSKAAKDLASGPGRLAAVMGFTTADSGRDALVMPYGLVLPNYHGDPPDISSGPRVGVAGEGGSEAYPWRYWLTGDPTVSRYRPARIRTP